MKRWVQPTPRRLSSGFSLMEVLVAVSLLAFIVGALLLTFNQTQRTFRRSVNQVDVLEGGRSAMLTLSRELQELHPTSGWSNTLDLVAVLPDNRPALTVQLPGGESRLNFLQRLAFVSRLNDEWFVTGYQVLDNGMGVGPLFRWRVRTPLALASSNVWFAVARWVPDPATDSRLIDGVVHFQLTAYGTVGGTNGAIVPWRPIPWLNGQGNVFPDLLTSNALPSSLGIELGVLEPQTLTAFRARTNIASFDPRAYLADRASRMHVFKQQIPVRATPGPEMSWVRP